MDRTTVLQTAVWVVAVAAILLFMAVGFLNPDMTAQRLIIDFWPVYMIGIMALLVAGAVSHRIGR